MAVTLQDVTNLANFQDAILSDIVVESAQANYVMKQLVTDSTDEWKEGAKTVSWSKNGTFTARQFDRTTGLITTDDPTTGKNTLTIDQEYYNAIANTIFDEKITRKSKRESDLKEMGFAIAKQFDDHLFTHRSTFAASGLGTIASAAHTGKDFWNDWVSVRTALSVGKCPFDGQIVAVVGPRMASRMMTKTADSETNWFMDANNVGNAFPALNGRIKVSMGITIYESQNVPVTELSGTYTEYGLVFHKSAIEFVEPVPPGYYRYPNGASLGFIEAVVNQYGSLVQYAKRGLVWTCTYT